MLHLGRLLLLLVFATNAVAGDGPAPFVAVYALSQGSLSFGTMERRYELKADGAYRFLSRMKTSGVLSLVRSDKITESSNGRLRDGHFVPDTYSYHNSRGDKHFALRFDHANGQVQRSDQARGWSAAMPAAALDKLVYQMQMMLDLPAQPATLRYSIADKNKLKDYLFDNRGREQVATDAGRYQAVRLERGARDAERRTVVWCAEELDWLPVKVEYREKDGSVTTALLRSFKKL
ncbi:MAG: DUF3108 domain-containing protein [Proteobacteria bacterium]|nr:DUF3108 domain-containing protein [Pseudomonadota bacterium]MBK8960929.1 DUF3108 domain-containing protein [Pseudomonadota bacterium]